MSECIVWKGSTHDGYPMLGERRVHRYTYEAQRGPVPRGYVVHHACENKLCVNPSHLRAITRRDHMRLHRAWESSPTTKPQPTCRRCGRPKDGTRTLRGERRAYCRPCHSADCRARYQRRKAERTGRTFPKSAEWRQAFEADESPAPSILPELDADSAVEASE